MPNNNIPPSLLTLLQQFLAQIPTSKEEHSDNPNQRAQHLARNAAIKSATISGGLALPPGPAGLLTVIPDLALIWKVQAKLVADIAAVYGKTAYLTRESMIYCLFKHGAAQVLRELVIRTGERVLIRRASLRAIQIILQKLGVRIAQRVASKAISRWLPIVGAVGIGAYAYWDTVEVAKTAIETFSSKLKLEGSPAEE